MYGKLCSREADELSPADILFLNILTELYQHIPLGKPLNSNSEHEENSSEEFFSPESSPQHVIEPTEEHVDTSEPVSYTHLDVYKRQAQT